MVILPFFRTAHAVQLACFLNSHFWAHVQFRRTVAQVILLLQTSVVCAARLDFSAPRSHGCVGEPFFPLRFHSPGVVGRPSSCLGLSALRLCGRVGWSFAPPHLLSSVVMALAFVAPFRCVVVVVCKLRQSCARRVKMVGARQEDGFPSAPSLCPAECRTLSFRRVSWWPLSVFPVQAPLLSATVAVMGAPSR